MPTLTAFRRGALVTAIALVLGSATHDGRPDWVKKLDADELELVGFAGRVPDSAKPKITAFFPEESYARGTTARLRITDSASRVDIQVFRAGMSSARIAASDVMTGKPMTRAWSIGAVSGSRTVAVALSARWPSGLYFARLTAPGDRIGYATFVLRPQRLGRHSVAVVMPTQTWQAYNFRDDNGDKVPDTWYASGSTARLSRPFLNRGVPPHYKYYDHRFQAWVNQTQGDVDYLSDADLNGASGEQLRNAYQLLVFEGHHEYVTKHEYDAITAFRDLGGNLMFLSANNFFWKIQIKDHVMTRIGQWRDLGRPEAALIGVQYFHNDTGEHRGPWIVRRAADSVPWMMKGTGLEVGSSFSSGGIEADGITSASPRNVQVLAAIPNLYGDGRDAEMTYYETQSGAKVFAAGAFTLAGSVWQGHVEQLMSNLWRRLSQD
jgi:hypothetical protein